MLIILFFTLIIIFNVWLWGSDRPQWETINHTTGETDVWYTKEMAEYMLLVYEGDNIELKPIKYKWGFLWRL